MARRSAGSTEWVDIGSEGEEEQETTASGTAGGERAGESPARRWGRLVSALRRIIRLRKIWSNLGQHLKRYTALK